MHLHAKILMAAKEGPGRYATLRLGALLPFEAERAGRNGAGRRRGGAQPAMTREDAGSHEQS
ncbi:hypothetical protein AHIS1636_02310 [Arthrobacter mangrovi]|uniref:Uncharacterized protein n=1 Tax=Arthrobacter mangrovi TaxID=2966350 RepID=A0ABQ5MQB4_9MICC|nr:hypothetical protein AHIS1636_02310 [Arthrobacter mangrovi]